MVKHFRKAQGIGSRLASLGGQFVLDFGQKNQLAILHFEKRKFFKFDWINMNAQIITSIIVVFVILPIIGLWFSRVRKSAKEQNKVRTILEELRSSKRFPSTVGMWITFICFFLAGPALFFNYKSEGLGGSILIIAPIIVSAFFVFMFYHFLRTIIIGDTSITIRPSFLYLANWKFADVSINYEDISNVEVARDNQKNSIWISIYLWTKDGKKTKLNYGLHNSEVGEALYIFLKDKIGQLSETEKEQLIARGVAME